MSRPVAKAMTRKPAYSETGRWSERGHDDANTPRSTQRSLRVLVVDDDKDATDMLSLLVETWGHQVQFAYDAKTGLEMASAHSADVAVVDLAMPGMDGCQLARLLRRRDGFRDALLIALTGYADRDHRLLCEQAGFDRVLVKPLAPPDLKALLQQRAEHMDGGLSGPSLE
jgi:CheY-like chemotaxis protein